MAVELVRFSELPRLSSHVFTHGNMVRSMMLSTPVYLDTATGQHVVEPPWSLVGWSDRVEPALMTGREGQIALMMFHPVDGHAWEHYPLFDDEERAAAVFYSRKPRWSI